MNAIFTVGFLSAEQPIVIIRSNFILQDLCMYCTSTTSITYYYKHRLKNENNVYTAEMGRVVLVQLGL